MAAQRAWLNPDTSAGPRGAQLWILAVALVLFGFSLGLAVLDTNTQPAWARFTGVAVGILLVVNALLQLLSKGHSGRRWLWAGWIVSAVYAIIALVTLLA